MSSKIIFVACALLQSALGQFVGGNSVIDNNIYVGNSGVGLANAGFGSSGIINSGLAGSGIINSGFGAGIGNAGIINSGFSTGFGNAGFGAGVGNAGLGVVSSSPLIVTSISPIGPSGLAIASENTIEGILTVTGSLPYLSAVAFDGALPTAGAGVATCGCGNGEVGIVNAGLPGGLGYGTRY